MEKQLKITMDHQVRELCEEYLLTVGGTVAQQILQALRTDDFWAIIRTRVDPRLYTCYDSFRRDYLAAELLRKYPGFPIDLDRVEAAVKLFWESERQCWRTNRRLYPYVDNFGCQDEGVHRFIDRVRKKILRIIGSKPPEITELCGFGPGATYDCRGKHVLSADKLEKIPTRTKALFSDISHIWLYGQTMWCQNHGGSPRLDSIVVRGNRFTTVPKDSEKDRGICIEPTLNVYIQKGYGKALRTCLKRVGIDLDMGQSRHGVLAEWASARGDYATIDLSSASDSVSKALVELLLPPAWYEALAAARCAYTEIQGKWVRLEKFSSMGNGYTFELETLIFAAICSCLVDERFRKESLGQVCFVYGDDIIVPSDCSADVIAALAFFGFTVNSRKTFCSGSFRESCGTDAFDGQVVRPFRIDSVPEGDEWWISAANAVRRALGPHDGPYSPPWDYCLSRITLARRKLRGPERLGDAVIHDPFWGLVVVPGTVLAKKKPRDKRFSPGTYWVRALCTVTKPISWNHWSKEVMLATRLYSIGDNVRGHTGRGCVTELREGWVSVS